MYRGDGTWKWKPGKSGQMGFCPGWPSYHNDVLKLIIDIQHSNPLIVNKYIIADDATLIKLVSLLCNATEVHIDADDIECGCTAKNTYRKVHAIFVVVNGETKNLKYDFSDVMYTLKELHISTKFVWWSIYFCVYISFNHIISVVSFVCIIEWKSQIDADCME